jgi:NAD-dependent deacetylase
MLKRLETLLEEVDPTRDIVFLTGAGISAESGIPTFRGPEGYWTVGSEVYHPQQMATWANFQRNPREVWRWYLYRRGVCNAAAPNPAHEALVELEQSCPDRFHLITQNIDGLHRRAGNSPERIYEVHGNGHEMRCAGSCSPARWPIPEGVGDKGRDDPLSEEEFLLLACPLCGGPARPHVLWFDEYYEEVHHRSESAMRAAMGAGIMVIVGTAGATNLPNHAVSVAAQVGAVIIDVNPNPNVFQRFADEYARGLSLNGAASHWVPEIAGLLARDE